LASSPQWFATKENYKIQIEMKCNIFNSSNHQFTQGYLHEGHLSLTRLAKKDCKVVGASIFVNPTQFAPHEDYGSYPRDLERDLNLLKKENVDFVFAPTPEEMYPKDYRTFVKLEQIDETTREGQARPGFFRGVATGKYKEGVIIVLLC
jgi:pantoate--beta-alanine ligase